MSASAEPARDFPRKMFYRINEVSQITLIKPYVLRYWETEFPQLSPSKDSSDQRRYKADDIDLVFEIKQLLYEEKFTIAGARRRLENDTKKAKIETVTPAPATKKAAPARDMKKVRRLLGEIKRDVANLHNFI